MEHGHLRATRISRAFLLCGACMYVCDDALGSYFYHSPKMCRVWGVSVHRMPQHVPLLVQSPAENRLEGDFSASFVCGVALGWLHTQQLEDMEDRERRYRAW